MIITKVVGNLADLPAAERELLHVERIELASAALTRRIQRVTSDHGREFGLRLDSDADLRDGDILLREGRNVVAVAVTSQEVLVIAPRGIVEALRVGHGLGNRHLPAQFFEEFEAPGLDTGEGVMVVQADRTVSAFLDHEGTPYTLVERVLEVPFRHASHTH
ncbi:MAG: urease accessory protein UreE [Propionibacteriaceae bacterium]|nr:urease accessory protein UreE [Propionibacteriaceae bacterium]